MKLDKKKINISILSHLDPLGDGIGGTKSFIKGFVEHAPDDFEIEWIGFSTNKRERPVGKWQKIQIGGKIFNFFPIFFINSENVKTRIPLVFYYFLYLFRHRSKISFENKILEFHRMEHAITLRNFNSNNKILFVHGNIKKIFSPYSEGRWSKLPWAYPKVERKVIIQMDKIFVVSSEGLDYYKRQYPFMAERFCFTPTFVDTNTFHPYSSEREKIMRSTYFKKKNGFLREDKLIIFVGRLENSKNPFLLLKSFKYLREYNPDSRLLVVGEGRLKNKLLKYIDENNLYDRIKLLGAIPNLEVAELMRLSDVLLMTSTFEGMSVSVLEALASGIPVVSTDVGEAKKVVKDNFSGKLLSKNFEKNIAKAVVEVLEKGEKYTSSNCVDSIKEYTAKSVLERIYRVHYNLVE